jgi:hypothetical protein
LVRVARPVLETVQRDEVALGDRAHELDVLARAFARHALEVGDEGLRAVGDVRVVLPVRRAHVAVDRFAWAARLNNRS